jgi:serine/threonine protein kinase
LNNATTSDRRTIQHVHQKGLIHRDVKPSNVLVTMYDDKPVPKVIDFGVAKAIEQRLTERTMFTQFSALVDTFEYMSPEQAEMNAFGVDTRSDIYSLGVLLYELLTGTTPLERQRLREAGLGELVRLIREEEAPRPTQRLSSSNNLLKIAAARKTEPARLSRLVQGEIANNRLCRGAGLY